MTKHSKAFEKKYKAKEQLMAYARQEAGASFETIGQPLGMSRQAIHEWMKRAAIMPRKSETCDWCRRSGARQWSRAGGQYCGKCAQKIQKYYDEIDAL